MAINPYLLDTNSYFLFFQHPKTDAYYRLTDEIKANSIISFHISEISSMEIHSVLGKYRRGSTIQFQKCKRKISSDTGIIGCGNTWINPGRKKMKRKVYRGIRKIIADIEKCKGDIWANVLELNQSIMLNAKRILYDYSDTQNIGSHDAIILATFIHAVQNGVDDTLTFVTSDKGLKSVLKIMSIPYYDPKVLLPSPEG